MPDFTITIKTKEPHLRPHTHKFTGSWYAGHSIPVHHPTKNFFCFKEEDGEIIFINPDIVATISEIETPDPGVQDNEPSREPGDIR